VGRLSRRLCSALNERGLALDADLAEAAGLLHDVVEGLAAHADEGFRMLSWHGFDRIAGLVRWHIDLPDSPPSRLAEREIVYLIDKLVDGCRVVGLSTGRRRALRRKGRGAEVRANIGRRFDDALRIQELVESRLGGNLMETLHG
jgi:hypothetical protein